MSGNTGVERIFPVNSPSIQKIELNKKGKVRRSRIFYFRNLTGKKAKIKEKSLTYLTIVNKYGLKVVNIFVNFNF